MWLLRAYFFNKPIYNCFFYKCLFETIIDILNFYIWAWVGSNPSQSNLHGTEKCLLSNFATHS